MSGGDDDRQPSIVHISITPTRNRSEDDSFLVPGSTALLSPSNVFMHNDWRKVSAPADLATCGAWWPCAQWTEQ
jgi:hypothetical protein